MLQAGPLGHLRISPGVFPMRALPCASPGTQRPWLAKSYTCFYQSTPSAYNSHWVPVSINLLPQFSRKFYPRLLTNRPPDSQEHWRHTRNGKNTLLKFGRSICRSWGYLVNHLLQFPFSPSPSWIEMPLFSSQKPTSGEKRVKLKKKEFFSFSEKN